MSLNRRQFFQRSTAVAALCADGMLPSSLEAQSPAAPVPRWCAGCCSRSDQSAAGVRVAGILMIPVVGGKYKVWNKPLGSGKTKVLLLHGGPAVTHGYLEAMESFLPDAGIEMYHYGQLGCGNSDIPDNTSLWALERYTEEVEEVRPRPGELCALWLVVGRHAGDWDL